MNRYRCTLVARIALGILIGLAPLAVRAAEQAAQHEAAEARLADSVRYLASDELQGRGLGTKGLDLAAGFIAQQFADAGVRTDLIDDQAFQKFAAPSVASLGPDNRLKLVGPGKCAGEPAVEIDLAVAKEYRPLAMSGSGTFDLPLVFAGYGITTEDEKYDDYAGIDAKGKAVVVLRHEPDRDNPKSVFNGTKDSKYAPLQGKVTNALKHGAAAVVFCTGQFEIDRNLARVRQRLEKTRGELEKAEAELQKHEPEKSEPESKGPRTPQDTKTGQQRVEMLRRRVEAYEKTLESAGDPEVSFTHGGPAMAEGELPVVHCRRGPLELVFDTAVKTDLATLEKRIDEGPAPCSHPLQGWRLVGQVDVRRSQPQIKNVVAVLPGEGPLADETIVLGAHYDHVGWGSTAGSLPKERVVCNGADDNASGVAVLVEVARRLAQRPEKLPRRIVFIAFAGEERGMLGSAHYVKNPSFPLEKTVAMLNLDMVGRLRDSGLMISGLGSAKELPSLVDRLNQQHKFALRKIDGGGGASDHAPFLRQKIPAVHFCTGLHADYHRPSDDFAKINVPGMCRVVDLAVDMTVALAQLPRKPEFTAAKPGSGGRSDRPVLGIRPDLGHGEAGVAIAGLAPGGPAEKAGLRIGDVILQLDKTQIGSLDDLLKALAGHKAGDRVSVTVRRGGKDVPVELKLSPRR